MFILVWYGNVGSVPRRSLLPPISSPLSATGAEFPSSRVLPSIGMGRPSSLPHQLSSMPASNLPTYREASLGSPRQEGNPLNYYNNQARNAVRGSQTGNRSSSLGIMGTIDALSDEQIHLAALEGISASQMKNLALQCGVDYRDSGGRTPLMYAVLGNQPKMCEVLLKLKASINARDLTGHTPLLWATYQSKPDVMRVLLK